MRSHKTTVFADDFWLLEGPRWHEGRLWVSDLLDGKVYSLDADGKRTLVCEVPNRPSGLGFMPDGALIIASMQDRRVLKYANGVTTVLADLWEHATGDVNDLLVDERGYTYVGNFGYDLHNGAPSTPTNMHVVSPDGAVQVAASGLEFPNGTVIADGGRTLIVAETWAGRLTAYDRDEEGRLSNRRIIRGAPRATTRRDLLGQRRRGLGCLLQHWRSRSRSRRRRNHGPGRMRQAYAGVCARRFGWADLVLHDLCRNGDGHRRRQAARADLFDARRCARGPLTCAARGVRRQP